MQWIFVKFQKLINSVYSLYRNLLKGIIKKILDMILHFLTHLFYLYKSAIIKSLWTVYTQAEKKDFIKLENKNLSQKNKNRNGKYIYSYMIDDISERETERERERDWRADHFCCFDVLNSS